MHCVVAKFVPRLLSEDQKQNRVDVNKEFVDHANTDEHF
jgi:desulfoferrodoxin (superoxide reductase-like protein)